METRVGGAMRSTATLAAVAAVSLLALMPVAQGQPHEDAAYTYRAALGDIPGTSAREAANAWNVQETLVFDANTTTARVFTLPAGATFTDLVCTCNGSMSTEGNVYRFTLEGNNSGVQTLTFTHVRPITGTGTLVKVTVPGGERDDARVVLYTGTKHTLETDVVGTVLPAAGAPGDLWVAEGTSDSPLAGVAAAVLPVPVVAEGQPLPGPVWLLGGLLVGMAVWFVLVQQGVVQKRSRKQVASVAQHKEVAQRESAAVLKGRKAALMAALKEIEKAKASGDIDLAVYDTLKGEYKRQAVTVMRALEEAKAT